MKKRALRIQPSVKTQLKLSTSYIIAGSAFLIMSVIGVFLYLNLAGNQNAQAGTKDPTTYVANPGTTQMLSVSLQKTNGQVLMQQQVPASDPTVDVNMPKELPAGLYLLKVKGGKQAESQSISLYLAPSK